MTKHESLNVIQAAGLRTPRYVVIGNEQTSTEIEESLSYLFGSSQAISFAVRSSADVEDGKSHSFAGVFKTMLGVPKRAVSDAVTEVRESLSSHDARNYSESTKARRAQTMSVIVQEMVNPRISGVAFSQHPSKEGGGRVIESCWGLGESLVSGELTPELTICNRDGGLLQVFPTIQREKKIIDELGFRRTVSVGLLDQSALKLRASDRITICEALTLLERYFEGPIDIEWAFVDSLFYVLQARPLTAVSSSHQKS